MHCFMKASGKIVRCAMMAKRFVTSVLGLDGYSHGAKIEIELIQYTHKIHLVSCREGKIVKRFAKTLKGVNNTPDVVNALF